MATRRQFLLASALGALASTAVAQSRKLPRVGVLHVGSSKEPAAVQREPFERGLRELGWTHGATVILDYRYAEGELSKLAALAKDLAQMPVDVIVARGNTAIAAARKATSTIPIVMSAYTGDPAADGIVKNAARPGGNVTGLGTFPVELGGKRLEILKEMLPRVRRVGLVFNPEHDGVFVQDRLTRFQTDARAIGVEVVPFEIRRPGDIAPVYAAIGKVHVDALSVRGDPQVLDQSRAELAAHALKLGLPSIYEWPFFVEAGGLISYGDSIPGFHHRSASYVSRILKGEKAGDLPIEQPSKFNMVVNLKTAKALRIEIPKSVMFRVDRVIE